MIKMQRKLLLSVVHKNHNQLGTGETFAMDSGAGSKRLQIRGKRDFTPVTWDQYFERMSDIRIADDVFRVYEVGKSGPVCFFLHGGGFSALSWAILSKLLPGLVSCRCTAMDFRGHGDTHTSNDENLEAEVLARDVGSVVNKIYGDDTPPIILIGHSMGGAIATRIVSKNIIPAVIGLIVIDVVEGTAMEALNSMQSFLQSRPSTFKSIDSAIEYCFKSGQIKNLESAKVSVVGQVKRIGANETTTSLLSHQDEANAYHQVASSYDTLYEEEDENLGAKPMAKSIQLSVPKTTSGFKSPTSVADDQYSWRIDLAKTEKFWKGWFQGLSKMFLACNAAKLLLLAGVDRLDKDLTVGQMQGKFQIQVLPQCGHAVHEDNPEKVAEVIASFLVRNRFVELAGNFQRQEVPGVQI